MKGVTFGLASGAFYATVSLFIKLALESTNAIDLIFLRLSLSTLIAFLILVAIEKGKTFNVTFKELKSLAILGFFSMISYALYIAALNYTTVSNAILLIYLGPAITAFFCNAFPRRADY